MDTQDSIPYGYCHCGCGNRTGIIAKSNASLGWVRGEPKRFLHGHVGRTQRKEFDSLVDRGGPDDCWLWLGAQGNGPGSHGLYSWRGLLAHRVAYERANGQIPDGLLVCHTCDNPPCVNPAHLFLGTHEDNMRDMVSKGRAKSCGKRELTAAAVREIRSRYAAGGILQRDLAAEYGMTVGSINSIIRRRTWANISG